jgi:hypothetical protein
MNSVFQDNRVENPDRLRTVTTAVAERELTAFFNAVTQLFGKEQAELSAEDWLRELIEMEGLPPSTGGWRSITVKAARRLADRVKALYPSTQFTTT